MLEMLHKQSDSRNKHNSNLNRFNLNKYSRQHSNDNKVVQQPPMPIMPPEETAEINLTSVMMMMSVRLTEMIRRIQD